jgi:hypothetical protein
MLDDKSPKTKLRWQFGLVAGVFLLIFALYPQLKLIYLRGSDWQGAYAFNDLDEVAYSAYLRALIDGRPRKNDPYTRRDDSPETPQEESLFSIQFAAPYTVAIPARIFGLSASSAMTVAGGVAAFFAALSCFWLLGRITEDSLLAMAGALVVLACGALAAGEGAIGEVLGNGVAYPYFPFLRRYIPAVPFPVFFALMASVWSLVASAEPKKRIFWSLIASFSFSYLVFSYFYLWTTAAAWLVCVGILWLLIRPANWMKDCKAFAILVLACFIPLLFYAYLLSQRSHTMDNVQLLVFTRELDLLRVPELISYAVLVMLVLGIAFKLLKLRDKSTIFVLSFALVPIVVFNQQFLTGRSLQPIHYQVFIGNYVAILALFAVFAILWRGLKDSKAYRPILLVIAIFAITWGFVESHYTVRISDEANVVRDGGMELAKHLESLDRNGVILPLSMIQGDDSPTLSPQPVLWARHQHVFAGVTWQENKERYYQLLYYQGLDEKWLENRMKNEGDFVSIIALFGWGRHTDRLNAEYKPLTFGEIEEEVKLYGVYYKNFSLQNASSPAIKYVIIPTDWIDNADFSNIDFWYSRNEPEKFGDYTLYRLSQKNRPSR